MCSFSPQHPSVLLYIYVVIVSYVVFTVHRRIGSRVMSGKNPPLYCTVLYPKHFKYCCTRHCNQDAFGDILYSLEAHRSHRPTTVCTTWTTKEYSAVLFVVLSFFFLRGPQGAANGQDSWGFFKDAQGFGRLDAGSRAGFASSRPPPPWTSVFHLFLFLYNVWP